ncbi:MAG: hypothetical protein J3Q66DRAFT_431608 [Benniella sp.]|nr:MAG: hypothetical protein J3Q66DRAFT_431608 [Benniella sp.]
MSPTFPGPNDITKRLQQQAANMADQIASLQKPKESDEQLQEQLPNDIADDEFWDYFCRHPENATMRYKPLKVPSAIQLSPAQISNDQQLSGLRKCLFHLTRPSEEGDLHKVSIDYTGDIVNEIRIKYFDTVSVASSLCILKSGFLFVASEFGNHHFYQFEKLDDDDTPEYSSKDFMMTDGERLDIRVYFKPRPLENLLFLGRRTCQHGSINRCKGIRHIRANKQVTEWRAPGGRQIVRAATNRQQVVIAMTGGELVYFEVDDSGNLSESHPLSMQALSGVPESLVMIDIPNQLSEGSLTTLYLNIGLQNGALLPDRNSDQLQLRIHLNPLSYDALEYAASFTSELCLEWMIAEELDRTPAEIQKMRIRAIQVGSHKER